MIQLLAGMLVSGGIGLAWFGTVRFGATEPGTTGSLVEQTWRRLARRLRRQRAAIGLAVPAALLGAASGLLAWWLFALPVITLLAATAAGYAPYAHTRLRAERQAREREQAWPAALDQLADALESGLGFPAAVQYTSTSGPAPLRQRFAGLYQALRDGHLEQGLDQLATSPERAAAATAGLLRAAFVDTNAGRVAPVIRNLAHVLRRRFEAHEQARSRAIGLHREAAVLAVSPLGFLLLIGATAPGYLNAYRTAAGTAVSLSGALVIFACYLAMRRLGHTPQPGQRP